MSTPVSGPGLQPQLAALEARIAELEARLAELAARVEPVLLQHAAQAPHPGGAAPDPAAAAQAPPLPAKITPELARVIRLVQQGQGDEAQRELRRIPDEQLAQQPEVVALVAAALCVQRGDYATGLKALERARTLTNDPRLLRVIQLIEEQTG